MARDSLELEHLRRPLCPPHLAQLELQGDQCLFEDWARQETAFVFFAALLLVAICSCAPPLIIPSDLSSSSYHPECDVTRLEFRADNDYAEPPIVNPVAFCWYAFYGLQMYLPYGLAPRSLFFGEVPTERQCRERLEKRGGGRRLIFYFGLIAFSLFSIFVDCWFTRPGYIFQDGLLDGLRRTLSIHYYAKPLRGVGQLLVIWRSLQQMFENHVRIKLSSSPTALAIVVAMLLMRYLCYTHVLFLSLLPMICGLRTLTYKLTIRDGERVVWEHTLTRCYGRVIFGAVMCVQPYVLYKFWFKLAGWTPRSAVCTFSRFAFVETRLSSGKAWQEVVLSWIAGESGIIDFAMMWVFFALALVSACRFLAQKDWLVLPLLHAPFLWRVHLLPSDGHVYLADMLLANAQTYKLELSDSRGNTPLHGAVREGNLDAVKELLGGSDAQVSRQLLNKVNTQKQTPLILAAVLHGQWAEELRGAGSAIEYGRARELGECIEKNTAIIDYMLSDSENLGTEPRCLAVNYEQRDAHGRTYEDWVGLIQDPRRRKALLEFLARHHRYLSERRGLAFRYIKRHLGPHAQADTGLEDPTMREWLHCAHSRFAGDNAEEPHGRSQICPRDGAKGCSLIDSMDPCFTGRATHYLSWTYSYRVSVFVSAIKEWFRVTGWKSWAEDDIYTWCCMFCNNQFRIVEKWAGSSAQCDQPMQHTLKFLESQFGEKMDAIRKAGGSMIALLDTSRQPTYIKRVWCLWEFYMAKQTKMEIEWAMPEKEVIKFRTMSDIDTFKEAVQQIDIHDSSAHSEDDKRAILDKIRTTHGGLQRMNEDLRTFFIHVASNQFEDFLNSP